MTAPTSIHPRTVEDLYPGALALADQLGEVPSRNRLQKEFRIGAPKATALRQRLMSGTAEPIPVRTTNPMPVFDYAVPVGPDPAPTPVVPEPAPADRLVPVPVEVLPPVEPSSQVRVDGHPGTKISADMPAKRVAGRGWAYAGVVLGGVVSIAANVAHTYLPKPPDGAPVGWVPAPDWSPSPLAVVFSVFWPVALFVAVEILTRVPWGDGARWVWARVVGVLPVALVAAVVSYRHLSGLLEHFGEDPLTVAIGPLAIDGLMVMASAALLATGRRKSVRW